MENFMNYVRQLDPKFPASIRGAKATEIESLERLVGLPLPASYRQFLTLMGQRASWMEAIWMQLNDEAITDIAQVIEFYQNYVAKGRLYVPPHCIAVAVFGITYNVCLLCEKPGEPPVAWAVGNRIKCLRADSLEKYLGRLAFMKYHLKLYPFHMVYWNKDARGVHDKARAIAMNQGFKPFWFADSLAFCGEKAGQAICVQHENEGLAVRIGGQNELDVGSTADPFVQEFVVRPVRVPP